MIKSCFLKLVFCMVLIMGLSCSFAFADEVVLTPSDSVSVIQTINGTDYFQSPKTVTVNQDSLSSCPSNNSWAKGSLLQTDYKTFYQSQGSGSRNTVYCNLYQSEYFKGFYDFTLSTDTCVVSLDTSGLIPGYYRYECDLYFGMSFQGLQYSTTNLTLNPTFTYSSAPVALSDSDGFAHGMLYLVGQDSNPCICSDSGSVNTIDSYLVHVRLESTFLLSQGDILVKWNIGAGLSYLFSDFSYDLSSVRAYNNSRYLNAYFSNRFKSSLFGNVDPPVTPTPTVTPYPGQDTQESINQGVSNIEGQMNQLINSLNPVVSPIPTPADFTIDETLFDELETMTLPDISDTQSTYSALWDIFNPLWWIIGLMFSIVFVIGIFLYVLRGGFI